MSGGKEKHLPADMETAEESDINECATKWSTAGVMANGFYSWTPTFASVHINLHRGVSTAVENLPSVDTGHSHDAL